MIANQMLFFTFVFSCDKFYAKGLMLLMMKPAAPGTPFRVRL